MKHTSWTRRFEIAARRWQKTLGLSDWAVTVRAEKSHAENLADVAYECRSRCATITVYASAAESKGERPGRIALHEMLHVLFADMTRVAALRGDQHHDDVILEEHRVIERLLNAIDGVPE